MRPLARPSPYGLWMRAMRLYSASSSSKRSASYTIRSASVPTSFTVPAATASGRSVFSRITDRNARHAAVLLFVVQQAFGFVHDPVCVRAHQFHGAGGHRFGPLGLFPHHENGLSERRPFFLDAA